MFQLFVNFVAVSVSSGKERGSWAASEFQKVLHRTRGVQRERSPN